MKFINYDKQSKVIESGFSVNYFAIETDFHFSTTPNNYFEIIISPKRNQIGIQNNTYQITNSLIGLSNKNSRLTLIANTFGFHIRLSPQQLRKITDIPFNLISKEPIGLEHVFGNKYPDFLVKLEDTEDTLKQQLIQIFLANHIQCRRLLPKPHILDIIKDVENISSVSQIQQITGLTERSLERYFEKEIGLSPRNYLSIERFNTLSLLLPKIQSYPQKISLFQAALSVGYYDQSHFIKHCKRYTGMTPEKYFKLFDSELSGTYNF